MTGAMPRFYRTYLVDPITGLPTGGNAIGTVYIVPPFTEPVELVGDQAAVTVLTPTAGKKLQIIGVFVTSDDATFDFKLHFVTSSLTVIRHFESGTLGPSPPINITGDTNEVLSVTITGSAAQNWFFLIIYAEVD